MWSRRRCDSVLFSASSWASSPCWRSRSCFCRSATSSAACCPASCSSYPVVAAGFLGGRLAAVAVAVAGAFALATAFLPPIGSPAVELGEDIAALIVFVIVALAVGELVGTLITLDRRRWAAESARVEALEAVDRQRSLLLALGVARPAYAAGHDPGGHLRPSGRGSLRRGDRSRATRARRGRGGPPRPDRRQPAQPEPGRVGLVRDRPTTRWTSASWWSPAPTGSPGC